jgi:uncharacterized membrane protein
MTSGRLEAFSDAVIAILMTIMVLELGAPEHTTLDALRTLIPTFFAYALSFVYLGIYWNNHHHMFTTVESVNGRILWANLHLLFWLSLFPVATAWMGENHFDPLPVAYYGGVSLLAAISYFILQSVIIKGQGPDSTLAKAIGNDLKGKMSPVLYALGIAFAFVNAWISVALYVVVAVMWFVPDRRIESTILS